MSDTKVWIHSYTGRQIDLQYPSPADIDALDIAHALSLLNRFTGHSTEGWSVAQHSVVGSIMAEVFYPEVKWLAHQFILHDATEAYLGDVSAPLKSLLPEYKNIEAKHRVAIENRFMVNTGGSWEKKVDLRMLATERQLFMPRDGKMWSNEERPFEFIEWIATDHSYFKDVGHDGKAVFWDYLWSPWAPKEAEDRFLDRMWNLGI